MIDKKKVKLMTKMASYEQNKGKEDFRINDYNKKDYVSIQRLYTFLWVTVGFVCFVALAFLAGMDIWMNKMSFQRMLIAGGLLIIVYIVLLITYLVVASRTYKKKHQNARTRVKKYNHDLTRLLKMYMKEN